jgi:hypothetical protein
MRPVLNSCGQQPVCRGFGIRCASFKGERNIMKIKTNVKAGDKKGDPPIVIIIKDPVISS